ncbi:MAG: MaoC family dehydratase [Negativicutes bacterium]
MVLFSELKIGDCYEEKRIVSSEDVNIFAKISGDKNPLHLSDEFAAQSIFKKRVAHGMLLSGYISAVIGMKFPGPGTIYLQQNLKFMRPVFVDTEVIIRVTVLEKRPEKNRVLLNTEVLTADGKASILGEALVKLER